MKRLFIVCTFLFTAFACSEDEMGTDEIGEYVSFAGSNSIALNEATHSIHDGYPLVIQYWAFKASSEDITISYNISGENVTAGVDFEVSPSNQIKIKAGKFLSDTIWVKTINNGAGSDVDRIVSITISNISDDGIGLGLGEPETNKTVSLEIIDDDCSGNEYCVFHGSLANTLDWGYGYGSWVDENVTLSADAVLDKSTNTLTLSGDLMYYDGYIPGNQHLPIVLTPDGLGSTTGTATFGTHYAGISFDNYPIQFIQIGNGSYNLTTKVVTIAFDIQYESEGDWYYWYTVESRFTLP